MKAIALTLTPALVATGIAASGGAALGQSAPYTCGSWESNSITITPPSGFTHAVLFGDGGNMPVVPVTQLGNHLNARSTGVHFQFVKVNDRGAITEWFQQENLTTAQIQATGCAAVIRNGQPVWNSAVTPDQRTNTLSALRGVDSGTFSVVAAPAYTASGGNTVSRAQLSVNGSTAQLRLPKTNSAQWVADRNGFGEVNGGTDGAVNANQHIGNSRFFVVVPGPLNEGELREMSVRQDGDFFILEASVAGYGEFQIVAMNEQGRWFWLSIGATITDLQINEGTGTHPFFGDGTNNNAPYFFYTSFLKMEDPYEVLMQMVG